MAVERWMFATVLLALLSCGGAAAAGQSPKVSLPAPAWTQDGDGDFDCNSPACGRTAVVGVEVRGTLEYFRGLGLAKNFDGKAMVNIIARGVEDSGYRPVNIIAASRRTSRDYVIVTAWGTVVTDGKQLGIALAFMFGPGDDVQINSVALTTTAANRNLAEAIRSTGY